MLIQKLFIYSIFLLPSLLWSNDLLHIENLSLSELPEAAKRKEIMESYKGLIESAESKEALKTINTGLKSMVIKEKAGNHQIAKSIPHKKYLLQCLSNRHSYNKIGNHGDVAELNVICYSIFTDKIENIEDRFAAFDLYQKTMLTNYIALLLKSKTAQKIHEESKNAQAFFLNVNKVELDDLDDKSKAALVEINNKIERLVEWIKVFVQSNENEILKVYITTNISEFVRNGMISPAKIRNNFIALLHNDSVSKEVKESLKKTIHFTVDKDLRSVIDKM